MDWFRWAELDVPPIGGVARVADVVGAFGDELSRVDSRVGDELSRVDSRLESSRILDLIVDVLHSYILVVGTAEPTAVRSGAPGTCLA